MVNNNTKVCYFTKLMNALNWIPKTSKKVFVGGDFNTNWNVDSNDKTTILDWSTDNRLSQKVDKNTWRRIITIDGRSVEKTSRLDLIFSSTEDATVEIDDSFTSDYNLLVLEFEEQKLEVSRTKIKRQNWSFYFNKATIVSKSSGHLLL